MSCRGLKCSSGVFLSDKSSRFPSAFLSFKKDPDEQARISSFGVLGVGLDEARWSSVRESEISPSFSFFVGNVENGGLRVVDR